MTDTATVDRPPSGNPDVTADAGRAAAEADAGANARAEPDGGAAKPANPATGDNVVLMPRSGMTPEPADAAGTSSGESPKRPRCERIMGPDRTAPCAACGQTFTDAIYKGQKWTETAKASDIVSAIEQFFPGVNPKALTAAAERYQKLKIWKSSPVIEEKPIERFQDILVNGNVLEKGKRVKFADLIRTEFASKAK